MDRAAEHLQMRDLTLGPHAELGAAHTQVDLRRAHLVERHALRIGRHALLGATAREAQLHRGQRTPAQHQQLLQRDLAERRQQRARAVGETQAGAGLRGAAQAVAALQRGAQRQRLAGRAAQHLAPHEHHLGDAGLAPEPGQRQAQRAAGHQSQRVGHAVELCRSRQP
jgi:hypothetical protein